MRSLINLVESDLSEMIKHRDRLDGMVVALNPSQAEFRANFKRAATGVLTADGNFVVGAAAHTLTHPEVLDMAGGFPDRYHLGVWPSKVIVELWDNFDEVQDLPDFTKVTRPIYERYGRYKQPFREAAGRAVRSNKHIQRAYGGVFKVFVEVYSPNFSDRPSGLVIREAY